MSSLPMSKHTSFRINLSLSLISLLLISPNLFAKSSDRDQPLDISADRNSGGLCSNKLFGNVQIAQGSMTIRSDQASVICRNDRVERIELQGSPLVMTQVTDSGDNVKITALNADFATDSEILLLRGAVEINQDRGVLKGETIRYNLNTGIIDGGGDGNRVQIRIPPRQEKVNKP